MDPGNPGMIETKSPHLAITSEMSLLCNRGNCFWQKTGLTDRPGIASLAEQSQHDIAFPLDVEHPSAV